MVDVLTMVVGLMCRQDSRVVGTHIITVHEAEHDHAHVPCVGPHIDGLILESCRWGRGQLLLVYS